MTNKLNEEWRPVPGYEGFYSVSNLGKIKSEDRVITENKTGKEVFFKGRILKPWITTGSGEGYYAVKLTKNNKRKHVRIHQAMCWAFYGKQAANIDVRHLDGNCKNNVIHNLAYGTRRQNIADAVAHKSWDHAMKLTAENVIDICRQGREGVSSKLVGIQYGISRNTITEIWRGEIWTHITYGLLPESRRNIKYTKLTEEQIKIITDSSIPNHEAAKILGFDRHTIARWRKKNIFGS